MVFIGVARPTTARHCLKFVSPIAVLTPQRRNFFGFSKTNDDKAAASTSTVSSGITEQEVRAAQKLWSDSIKKISKIYLEKGDFVAAAGEAAGELYGYGHTNVLFKPTKAAEVQFRPKAADAMSYFVGHKAVKEGGIAEDGGFRHQWWQGVVRRRF